MSQHQSAYPTLELANQYITPVVTGEKDATVRHDPSDDLQVGQVVDLVTEGGELIQRVRIRRTATANAIEALSLLEVFDAEYPAETPHGVIEGVNQHYDATISPSTTVRVICWGPEEAPN